MAGTFWRGFYGTQVDQGWHSLLLSLIIVCYLYYVAPRGSSQTCHLIVLGRERTTFIKAGTFLREYPKAK